MKKNVDAFDYAGVLCKALRRGVLLTTRSGDQVNTMTIGWGDWRGMGEACLYRLCAGKPLYEAALGGIRRIYGECAAVR